MWSGFFGGGRKTPRWSVGSIDAILILSLKADRARQGGHIVGLRVESISFIIGDKGRRKMSWRLIVSHVDKAGEDLVARRAARRIPTLVTEVSGMLALK
jgi:hypothetical protein